MFFSAQGQENLIIDKLNFEGNEHIQTLTLKEQIIMRPHSLFSEKVFKKEPVYFSQKLYEEDLARIRNFYQKAGYLNVGFDNPVVQVNKRDKVEITVVIRENVPIRIADVKLLVDSILPISEVLNKNELKTIGLQTEALKGKIFSDSDVEHDERIIAEPFYSRGYAYTQVKSLIDVDTSDNTAQITWNIDRGPLTYFGHTNVSGNKRIPSESILRQLNYRTGEVWSKQKVDNSRKQIYNQGMYRVASVKTQLSPLRNDTLPVNIHIQEAPRWETRFGAGYGSEDKFRTFADIRYLSFITHTGRLNFYAKHSGLEPLNLYLKFSQPSFLFPINTMVLYPFFQRQNEPGYKLDIWGYNITFLQNFSKQLNTSFGYIFEDVRLDTASYIPLRTSTSELSVYRKTGLVLGAIYSNSEPVLDPISGTSFSFNLKTNDLGFKPEMPFFRVLAEYKSYWGLRKGTVLALKVKMGGIVRTDDFSFIPIEERFYAGGSYSVRGWARSDLGPKDVNGQPIGGNSLFESSVEFRFDLGSLFKLSVFSDFGNVWEKSFSYHLNDLRYSAGFGLRVKTPIGPAGLDFARPVFDNEQSWQIHLNIGHSF